MQIYFEMFISFFQVGLFSIGGGYAALPLIQQQIVDRLGWMTVGEFADILAISQMTPGPIAINVATFVGTKFAGIPGSLVATTAAITAPFILSMTFAKLYYKYRNLSIIQGILGGLRPAVVAMIASAGVSMLISTVWGGAGVSLDISAIDFVAVALFIAAFVALRKFKVDQLWAMTGSGVLGLIIYSLLPV